MTPTLLTGNAALPTVLCRAGRLCIRVESYAATHLHELWEASKAKESTATMW
jgi:hypothetical protein